ncbi:MAG: DUF86 domain-containing protein [Candidatus Brocadiae bacterium]|nr:DUF86 domain-containing protein [Candidatus Brocadiia bacterium]
MKEKIGDKARLQHILDAIQEIENYTDKADLSVFQSNSMMLYASVKQLEIIGEAAKNLSEDFKNLCKEIPWSEISGLRNILVHEYFGVDKKIIWQIIQDDIPFFKKKLSEINRFIL